MQRKFLPVSQRVGPPSPKSFHRDLVPSTLRAWFVTQFHECSFSFIITVRQRNISDDKHCSWSSLTVRGWNSERIFVVCGQNVASNHDAFQKKLCSRIFRLRIQSPPSSHSLRSKRRIETMFFSSFFLQQQRTSRLLDMVCPCPVVGFGSKWTPEIHPCLDTSSQPQRPLFSVVTRNRKQKNEEKTHFLAR